MPQTRERVENIKARLWEIAENLHRHELTVQERADHIAEWVRLTEEANKGASCADIPRGRGQPQGGINAAEKKRGRIVRPLAAFKPIAAPYPQTVSVGISGNR